jgi:hypothetical protein
MCILHQILLGRSIQKRYDGRACSTHGGYEKFIQNVGWKTQREETTLET